MREYEITLTGVQPLLMHADDIGWADEMDRWKNDPKNKAKSKAGDDRTPAFRWLGSVYNDGKVVCIPADNLMRCLMEGGASVPVPGGRSGKTFKSQTQSGLFVASAFWPLEVRGKMLDWPEFEKMTAEDDYEKHRAFALKRGFMLYVRRAKIGTSKHIRVRPRFDAWSTTGILSVIDDQITTDVLRTILEYAGKYKGLGDWRPSSKTPGPYGTFEAAVKQIS